MFKVLFFQCDNYLYKEKTDQMDLHGSSTFMSYKEFFSHISDAIYSKCSGVDNHYRK